MFASGNERCGHRLRMITGVPSSLRNVTTEVPSNILLESVRVTSSLSAATYQQLPRHFQIQRYAAFLPLILALRHERHTEAETSTLEEISRVLAARGRRNTQPAVEPLEWGGDLVVVAKVADAAWRPVPAVAVRSQPLR